MILMSNLIAIRKRINSIASTIRVTKVMQMIATAKIAKIKQMMTVVERYGEETDTILQKYMHNTTMPGELKKYFSGFRTKYKSLMKKNKKNIIDINEFINGKGGNKNNTQNTHIKMSLKT